MASELLISSSKAFPVGPHLISLASRPTACHPSSAPVQSPSPLSVSCVLPLLGWLLPPSSQVDPVPCPGTLTLELYLAFGLLVSSVLLVVPSSLEPSRIILSSPGSLTPQHRGMLPPGLLPAALSARSCLIFASVLLSLPYPSCLRPHTLGHDLGAPCRGHGSEQVLKIRTFSLPMPKTPWLLFSNGPNSFSRNRTMVQDSSCRAEHDAGVPAPGILCMSLPRVVDPGGIMLCLHQNSFPLIPPGVTARAQAPQNQGGRIGE